MAKKVLVGTSDSHSEAHLYAQMLRDAGLRSDPIPARTEGTPEAATYGIYVDERDLHPENLRTIITILGKRADAVLLERFRTQTVTEAVAWFPTNEQADAAAKKLAAQGYQTSVEMWPWELSPYEDRTWALFLRNQALDARTAKTIWEICGEFADGNVLSPYRRLIPDG